MTSADQWLTGGMLLGVAAAFWGRLKLVAWRVVNLVVVQVRLDSMAAASAQAYLWEHYRRSRFGERLYGGAHQYVRPLRQNRVVGYERVGRDPVVLWRGWHFLVAANGPASNGMESRTTDSDQALSLWTLRFIVDLEALVIEAIEWFNTSKHAAGWVGEGGRYTINRMFGSGSRSRLRGIANSNEVRPDAHPGRSVTTSRTPDVRYLKWGIDDLGEIRDATAKDVLAFPPEITALFEDARRWKKSEKWYRERQIPWRRGYSFLGRPGNGKTSMARAIAQDLDLPIYAFDLASFSNEEFVQQWQQLLRATPCMALFEDIDAVFSKRTNLLGEEGGGLTFDCLLNCLSGVEGAEGVLTVVTTNKPEELDEALGVLGPDGLSTRPGRIDVAVELPAPDALCRRKIAERILHGYPEEIEALVESGVGTTGAQFQDLCGKVALRRYWEDAHDVPQVQEQGRRGDPPGQGDDDYTLDVRRLRAHVEV